MLIVFHLLSMYTLVPIVFSWFGEIMTNVYICPTITRRSSAFAVVRIDLSNCLLNTGAGCTAEPGGSLQTTANTKVLFKEHDPRETHTKVTDGREKNEVSTPPLGREQEITQLCMCQNGLF